MTTDKDKTNSSVVTILALYNNLLGGALLTFPILFKEKGLISSILVLSISAVISYITSRIYVVHSNEDQKDVQWTINRILGKKWENFFRFATGVFLLLIMVIEMDIIVDQIYSIIILILDKNGSADSIAPKDAIQFGRFSIQWLTLLMAPFILGLIFFKRINVMIRIAQYGSYMIFIYIGYVLVQFFIAVSSGTIVMDNIDWWSWDISGIAATCSYAFTVHASAVTVLKQNKNQNNNQRDLGITLIMGLATYVFISLAGALSTSGINCKHTLVDCYITEWSILLVQVTYLFGRFSNYPITMEIGRTRFLNIFFPVITRKIFTIFNICFLIIAGTICMLQSVLPFGVLMGIVGAFVCYFFIYLLPLKLHFGCLYSRSKHNEESLLEQSITSLQDQPHRGEIVPCNHSRDYVTRRPKYLRQVLYYGLNVLGIAIAVFDLYSIIRDIVDSQ